LLVDPSAFFIVGIPPPEQPAKRASVVADAKMGFNIFLFIMLYPYL
jgi:hypothetical protein